MPCDNCNCPFYALQAENGPLSAAEIQCVVSDAVEQVEFREGEVLFERGQPSSSLYFLNSGTVKICCHISDGGEQIVGLSSPENLLVGLESLNEEHYAYSAIAATTVCACKINHGVLFDLVHDRGDVALRLIGAVNAQLVHSRALMHVLGLTYAAAKIASFILLVTPKAQHGNCRFALPFSCMDIANILGLSEETVCRLMANMKRTGVIYAPRGNIEIRDWDQLRAIGAGATS